MNDFYFPGEFLIIAAMYLHWRYLERKQKRAERNRLVHYGFMVK